MEHLYSPPLESSFPAILQSIHDGVYIINSQLEIVFWNHAAETITGFKAEEVLASKCSDGILNHVDNNGLSLCMNGCPAAKCLGDGEPQHAHVYLHHKNGHRLPVDVEIFPIDIQGKVVGVYEVFRIKNEESCFLEEYQDLEKKAYTDELTGAWNRRHLFASLKKKLEHFQRLNWGFAIAFIDIDHFKRINDSFGHQVGDNVLSMISKTIMSNVRIVDELHRYGGEEFVLVLPGVHLDWQAQHLGEKMRHLVENSFILHGEQRISATVSIGITYAKPNDSVESLLDRADGSMYKAKQSGRNTIFIDSEPVKSNSD